MSNYVMTRYSYDKAKQYGLTVKLSKNPLKKLDVYKGNIFLASIGDSRYQDYPTIVSYTTRSMLTSEDLCTLIATYGMLM